MLEEKLDALIVAMNKNTETLQAVLAAGGATTSTVAAAAEKPAAGRKPKADAAPKPTTDEATLVAKFDALKATADNVPKLKAIIKDLGFTSLAELRAAPAKYDEAYAKLTAFEESLTPAADEDDL